MPLARNSWFCSVISPASSTLSNELAKWLCQNSAIFSTIGTGVVRIRSSHHCHQEVRQGHRVPRPRRARREPAAAIPGAPETGRGPAPPPPDGTRSHASRPTQPASPRTPCGATGALHLLPRAPRAPPPRRRPPVPNRVSLASAPPPRPPAHAPRDARRHPKGAPCPHIPRSPPHPHPRVLALRDVASRHLRAQDPRGSAGTPRSCAQRRRITTSASAGSPWAARRSHPLATVRGRFPWCSGTTDPIGRTA